MSVEPYLLDLRTLPGANVPIFNPEPNLPNDPPKNEGWISHRMGVAKIGKYRKYHPAKCYELNSKWKVWEFICDCSVKNRVHESTDIRFDIGYTCNG